MSAHTPKPWGIIHSPRPIEYMTAIVSNTRHGLRTIALVGTDTPEPDRQAANAALIVSAPDLLEALRVLTAFAATYTGDGATPEEGRLLDGYGEGIAHAVAAGRAAIARAEGRAP